MLVPAAGNVRVIGERREKTNEKIKKRGWREI